MDTCVFVSRKWGFVWHNSLSLLNFVLLDMSFVSCFLLTIFVCVLIVNAKKAKVEDPRECEVCISNLESIDKLIPGDKKSDRAAVEKAIGTHCTLAGFGSEWKPNPALSSPKVAVSV